MAGLLQPADGASVTLASDKQQAFTKLRLEKPVDGEALPPVDWLHLERSGKEDLTAPEKVEFTWESDGVSVFELAEDAEFLHVVKTAEILGNGIRVGNLKIAQTYYWRVNGSMPFRFTTADIAPRWMLAEGCSNIRDAGGWVTAEGRRIRQGLLFRGSELDIHHTVTGIGIRAFRDDLRIKTDLDVRGEVFGKRFSSEMGEDVDFVNLPVAAYEQFIANREVCKQVFDILCDKKRYPIYYHCWGGADRTGTMALLIGAVLGMSDEQLILDYELTSLSVWGDRRRDSDHFTALMAALEPFEGETIGERAVAYLDACGVDAAMRETLRAILLED